LQDLRSNLEIAILMGRERSRGRFVGLARSLLQGSWQEEATMLQWALTFFVLALIAGVVGLTGLAGAAANIAWILFVAFLVLMVVAAVANAVRGQPPV
jgi:uncharacterized membrane protein YtjA (UPF0391 family)